ncbi:MAG: hypothetical protein COA79_14375 [Planctomycetota bacterium]|nr:MAG: hypothetical protein COA79_14375 [Planctomycetota bacterium]
MNSKVKKIWATLLFIGFSSLILADSNATFENLIKKIADFNSGLIVHLDCQDPALTELIKKAKTKSIIHALCLNKKDLEKVRQYLVSKNLYGAITADQMYFEKLPYETNLVNLIYVKNLKLTSAKSKILQEINRVLTPEGILVIGPDIKNISQAEKNLKEAGFIKVEIVQGKWIKAVKARPSEMDDWSHYNYDASGNKVSHDKLVGPPTSVRWLAGQQITDHGAGNLVTGFVSAQGRNFYLVNEVPLQSIAKPQLALLARDAFNGLLLWKKPLPDNTSRSPLTLIASEDKVYAVLEMKGSLVQLDARTGEILQCYKESQGLSGVKYHEGKLIITGGSNGPISCLDAKTGNLLWKAKFKTKKKKHPGKYRIGMKSTDGQIFTNCVVYEDRLLILDSYGSPGYLSALDLKTGNEIFSEEITFTKHNSSGLALVSVQKGVLIVGEAYHGKAIHAVSTKTGKLLWSKGYSPLGHGGRHTEGFFVQGLYWTHIRENNVKVGNKRRQAHFWKGLDPKTGVVKRTLKYPKEAQVTHRCHMDKATDNFFIAGSMDLFGLKEEKHFPVRYTRGSCEVGSVPAQGLLFTVPNGCACQVFLRGFQGLFSEDVEPYFKEESNDVSFEKGPAFSSPLSANEKWEWFSFRGNLIRESAVSSMAPESPKIIWKIKTGEELLSPIMGKDHCLIASKTGKLGLYEMKTGKKIWEFIAGGAFDSPPTIYKGRVFSGCLDGWVYSLSLKTGELVWRFRASPKDRRTLIFGNLESRWPVSGSVAVKNDIVTVVAGKHSAVNGGLLIYGLKADSGKVLWKNRVYHPGQSGILGGVLISNGKDIVLKKYRINQKDGSIQGIGSKFPLLVVGNRGSSILHMDWWARETWKNGKVSGQQLAYDETRTIALSVFTRDGKPNGRGQTRPGFKDYWLTSYKDREKLWSKNYGIRARSLVLTSNQIIIGGNPDPVLKELEGKVKINRNILKKLYQRIPKDKLYPKTGKVAGLDVADGKVLWEIEIDSRPIDHGIAVSNGKLIVITKAGNIIALGK